MTESPNMFIQFDISSLSRDEKIFVINRIFEQCDRGHQIDILRHIAYKGRSELHGLLGFYSWGEDKLEDRDAKIKKHMENIVDKYDIDEILHYYVNNYNLAYMLYISSDLNYEVNIAIKRKNALAEDVYL